MAARQFLCSVALYSAWLFCGASWVVKGGKSHEDLIQNSTRPNRSCSSLTCLSRVGTGRSHHVPVYGEPIHRRKRPLHHERLRDGNGDVGGPTRSEHAAHPSHSYRFYIVRWGSDNN